MTTPNPPACPATCPYCHAEPYANAVGIWTCGTAGVLRNGWPSQTDACRIRELTSKLYAAERDLAVAQQKIERRDRLIWAVRPWIDYSAVFQESGDGMLYEQMSKEIQAETALTPQETDNA